MCVQCASTAMMASGAGAAGARAWLGAHRPVWMGPRLLAAFTVAIILVGLFVAAVLA